MEEIYHKYVAGLNASDRLERLSNLRKLSEALASGKIEEPAIGDWVNNHIHTTYSFSPYSPSKAVWMAYNAGLTTAGIIDHDSIGGAVEFIEAGKILGIATTIGVECRADFSGTELKGRRINNPDQDGVAYITLHGIPHGFIDEVARFFKPYSEQRNARNRKMVQRINNIFEPYEINIDFDRDVAASSMHSDGGSITERHLLFALSLKLITKFGKGSTLLDFLESDLGLKIADKLEKLLLDSQNPFYEYDLLGVLKSELVGRIYIAADAECPDIRDVIELSQRIGAISGYAYLGDVGDSVTGDKKTQKFEDDYIEELFKLLKSLGFNGVSYMPSRNTLQQLLKVKELCRTHGLFEISGEDINSPRQSFICPRLKDAEFRNLIDSTWALIGHEKAATENIDNGMFSQKAILNYPDLKERISHYKEIGLRK